MTTAEENAIKQALAEEPDFEEALEEAFADAVTTFGRAEVIAWFDDDSAFGACCGDDGEAFSDAIGMYEIAVQPTISKKEITALIKHHVRDKVIAFFTAAFGKFCSRYGIASDDTAENTVENVRRLQRENKTAFLGAVLAFYALYERLDGETGAEKLEAYANLGVRL